MLDRLVRPRIGPRLINDLRRLEVVELLDSLAAERSTIVADHVLSILRPAFNWHALRDDGFRSPIVPGMSWFKDKSRDRILSDDEIRSVWAALEGFRPAVYARLVRALLLMACRRSELGDLQGSEIDGDSIVVPAARVKAGSEHVMPITRALAGLLGDGEGFRF